MSITDLRRICVIRWVLPIILLICIASCEKSGNKGFTEIECEKFDHLLYSRTVTFKSVVDFLFEQYKDLLDEYEFPKEALQKLQLFYSLNIKYEVSAITYHTVTPTGEPILASGIIYYPKTFPPKGVIEISPFNESKQNCASKVYKRAEILPGIAAGYVCIIPDLIGYGSSESLPINYIQLENKTIISADMRKAAEEFVYNRYHRSLSKESILFGYSLGGSAIMALAREYQLNPSHGVKVRHIFAGGGAYEPLRAFRTLLEISRSDYTVFPNILCSINYYDNLELDFTKIFKGKLLENYKTWCDGYMSIWKLTEILGTDPNNYFSDIFINGYDTAEEYRPIMRALDEKKLPLDWIPQAKVHLAHASQDYFVPVECSDSMNEYLKSVGADVEYVKYDTSHLTCALFFGIDFTKFLLEQ